MTGADRSSGICHRGGSLLRGGFVGDAHLLVVLGAGRQAERAVGRVGARQVRALGNVHLLPLAPARLVGSLGRGRYGRRLSERQIGEHPERVLIDINHRLERRLLVLRDLALLDDEADRAGIEAGILGGLVHRLLIGPEGLNLGVDALDLADVAGKLFLAVVSQRGAALADLRFRVWSITSSLCHDVLRWWW